MQPASASSSQASNWMYHYVLTVCRRIFCWCRSFWRCYDLMMLTTVIVLSSADVNLDRRYADHTRLSQNHQLIMATDNDVFTQRRCQYWCPRTQFVEDRSNSTSSQTFSLSVISLVTLFHKYKLLNVGILSFLTQANLLPCHNNSKDVH